MKIMLVPANKAGINLIVSVKNNRKIQGITLAYSPAHSTPPMVLCSRSNDQIYAVLYCETSLSQLHLHVDVNDGCGPPWDHNAVCVVKYTFYIYIYIFI